MEKHIEEKMNERRTDDDDEDEYGLMSHDEAMIRKKALVS